MLLQRSIVDFNFQGRGGGGSGSGLTNIPTFSAGTGSTRTAEQQAAVQTARAEVAQRKEEERSLARESAIVHIEDPIRTELDVIFPSNGVCVYACATIAQIHACMCVYVCSCKSRVFADS